MSRVRMFNQYLPPYEAVVKAGVGSVMSSFNLIDYVAAETFVLLKNEGDILPLKKQGKVALIGPLTV